MREWTAVAATAAFVCIGTALAATALGAENADCKVAGHLVHADYPLPRVAAAVDKARQLDVLVVGAGSSTLIGPGGNDLAYPARLQVILGKRLPGVKVKVVTNVKPRRSATEMAEGFEKLLMEEKPALVIWQSGTVDAITGADPEEYRTTLDEGVETLQGGGADVVLMNMQYSPRTESMIAIAAYADNMRLVSQQREVPLFDRFALMKHWSELGTFDLYAATKKLEMAARIHECIAQLLADLINDGLRLARENPKPQQ
jgi:ABC-type amino acid transport substrate-binding protein